MSGIFGSDNYLGAMIWNKRNPKGDAKGLAVQHESILWAVKDADKLSSDENDLRRPKRNAKKILDMARRCIRKSDTLDGARKKFSDWLNVQSFSGGELAYKFLDDKGQVFRLVSMAWPNKDKAPAEYYEPLIHPDTGMACPVPRRGWRNTPKKMKELLENDLVVFGEDETTQPRRKYLLAENMFENVASVFDFGGSSDIESASMGIFFETMKASDTRQVHMQLWGRGNHTRLLRRFRHHCPCRYQPEPRGWEATKISFGRDGRLFRYGFIAAPQKNHLFAGLEGRQTGFAQRRNTVFQNHPP